MLPALTRELRQFLIAAKRSTYAAQGDDATVRPLLTGSKQLEYDDGAFAYRDIYFGMTRFVGQETVAHRGRVVWSMAYAGGLAPGVDAADVPAIYAALRTALLQPDADRPVRGPACMTIASFDYACGIDGGLDAFSGVETLVAADRLVYALNFAGGLLR